MSKFILAFFLISAYYMNTWLQYRENRITQTEKTWRLIDVLSSASEFLSDQGIENPRLEAERILGAVLDLERIDLYVKFDQPLDHEERQKYKGLLRRRAAREPLQYIIGTAEFMSLPFSVNRHVLIPRPETEILVESVIAQYRESSPDILDIGSGSGAVGVSLAYYISNARVTGIDISQEALEVSEKNACVNNVQGRTVFSKGDIFNLDAFNAAPGAFDAIVSNPPYVSNAEWPTLQREITEHEPRNALVADKEGLACYPYIVRYAAKKLKGGGMLAVEVGCGQADRVAELFRKHGFRGLSLHNDYNSIPRVVSGYTGQS